MMIRSAKYTQILVQQLDAWQQHENNARPFYRFSDSKHFNQTNSSKIEKKIYRHALKINSTTLLWYKTKTYFW